MYKVGLTGNYYSGHEEVSRIFRDFNVSVFDANLVTKFLLNYSQEHKEKIISVYGYSSYQFGLINMKRFHTNKDFNGLFDIIELDLLKFYEKFRIKHKEDFYTIFLFDHLFERGLNKIMNFNVSTYRPKNLRKSDMKFLTSLPIFTVDKILNSEYDELKKNNESDFVIHNYSIGLDGKSDIVIGLENQIKNLHQQIMKKKSDSIVDFHYPLENEYID